MVFFLSGSEQIVTRGVELGIVSARNVNSDFDGGSSDTRDVAIEHQGVIHGNVVIELEVVDVGSDKSQSSVFFGGVGVAVSVANISSLFVKKQAVDQESK